MFRFIPIKTALIAASLFAIAGCGGKKADDASAAAPPEQATQAKQKTVFDDQLKAVEKAKAVQQQLEDEKNKRDKEMEDKGA